MNLLRIHISFLAPATRCEWALFYDKSETIFGEDLLSNLPQQVKKIQLILPAAHVLITRARVPLAARRNAGSVLAYAIEDEIINDPDTNQVNWLGKADKNKSAAKSEAGYDLLSIIDKAALMRWKNALDMAGIYNYEIQCETLMLPYTQGIWSLAWNGNEGFVRVGKLEGLTTDCGDDTTPPLSLHMMLEEAKANNTEPISIAIYTTDNASTPDLTKWSQELAIPVHHAGSWDWRSNASDSGVGLTQAPKKWRMPSGIATHLRPAVWIFCAALIIHASALAINNFSLAQEQRSLRQQMESRFRETFPDAIAVSDPALQMRRKLSEARNAANQPDNGDFLVMIVPLTLALKTIPAAIHTVSYQYGGMTIELHSINQEQIKNIITELKQSGMKAEIIASPGLATATTESTAVVLTVNPL